jgi:pSer/pThr/pTyr-binding forkhead associated (FHA) protein
MGPLAAVERFLERLFERQSARLFKTAIRPVQVQRRLERVMEGDRARDGSRTIVPHRFVVRLHPDDLAALRGTAPELAATLADGALAFARSHAYTLLDRPAVALRPDPSVSPGDIVVDARDPHASAVDDRAFDEADDDAADDARLAAAAADPAGPPATPADRAQPTPDQTAVFVLPGIEGPRATIREIRPDRSSRSIAFDGRPLTIGRAPDNGIVLRDGRASRHHARIDARRGTLILSDLGSTNGSYVNDRQDESIALGEGDRIRVGTTVLLIEAIAAAEPRRPGDVVAPDAPDAVDRAGAWAEPQAAADASTSDPAAPA